MTVLIATTGMHRSRSPSVNLQKTKLAGDTCAGHVVPLGC